MTAMPSRTTNPLSDPARRSPVLPAVLLALALIAAGCGEGGGFFDGDGGSEPAITTEPNLVVAEEPYAWVRVAGSAGLFADGESYRLEQEDISASSLGYVVVGYEIEQYPDTGVSRNDGCRIWYSADGFSWEMLGYTGTSGKNWMHSVVAGGQGFVAAGETSLGEADAAIWTSQTGTGWTQAWTTPGDFDQQVNAVAAGGPGFVAVGETYPGEAAVWISRDGTTWEQITDDAFRGAGDLEMYDVVAAGPGLVAVGLEETADGYDGVVWTSRDGRSWTRVEDPDGVFAGPGSQQIRHVVAGGPGLVAVGVEEYASEVVWTSPDGLTWTREPPGSIVFRGPNGAFTAIAVGPSGPAAFWDGSIWLALPCSASDDEIAALAGTAGGEIDDSACAAERARGG